MKVYYDKDADLSLVKGVSARLDLYGPLPPDPDHDRPRGEIGAEVTLDIVYPDPVDRDSAPGDESPGPLGAALG